MICLILFLFSVHLSLQYETVTCGINKTLILNKDVKNSDLIFVQSPGFPNSMTEEEISNCHLNVTSNEANQTTFLTLVITNGKIQNIETISNYIYKLTGPMYYVVSDVAKLEMNFVNTSLSSWNAFQGYILFENNERCPFSINPFTFENETQVFYLKTHHMIPFEFKRSYLDVKDIFNDNSVSCTWSLRGPSGYGFKMVIKETLKNIDVSAVNSTGYDLIKGYGVIPNQVYYNSDNQLNIKAIGNGYFNAYFTIVKKEWIPTEAGCRFLNNKTWTNIGSSAYPFNSNCSRTISVPHNKFVLLKTLKFIAEPYIDYLQIVDCNGQKHYINHLTPSSWPFDAIFFPDLKKTENNLDLIFMSDGSVQNEGFELDFETLDCSCASSIIILPCEGEHKYSILNQTNQYICPQTVCNFTILLPQSCSSKHIVLTFHQEVIKKNNSFGFKIFVDDKIYVNSETFTKLYHEIFSIPFEAKNVLSFFATKNTFFEIAADLDFVLVAVEAPQVLQKVELSTNFPSLKIDLSRSDKNSIFTVELSEERILNNDTLEMYTAQFINLPCILLYSDKNLKRIDNSLMKMHELTHKVISQTSITIYISYHCKAISMPVLYRAKKAHSMNCRFTENIFNRVPYNPVTTEISKPTGPCEIVLLVHRDLILKTIWTSSKNENVTVSSGFTNETKPLISFNKNAANISNNITLNSSSFYSILIPSNSSLYVISFFPVKENITYYKAPSRYFNDIPSFEYIRDYKDMNNATIDTLGKTVRAEVYQTDSVAHLFYFDVLNKTKRVETYNRLTLLQDIEFNQIYNSTIDNHVYFHEGINFFLRPNVTLEDARKNDYSENTEVYVVL